MATFPSGRRRKSCPKKSLSNPSATGDRHASRRLLRPLRTLQFSKELLKSHRPFMSESHFVCVRDAAGMGCRKPRSAARSIRVQNQYGADGCNASINLLRLAISSQPPLFLSLSLSLPSSYRRGGRRWKWPSQPASSEDGKVPILIVRHRGLHPAASSERSKMHTSVSPSGIDSSFIFPSLQDSSAIRLISYQVMHLERRLRVRRSRCLSLDPSSSCVLYHTLSAPDYGIDNHLVIVCRPPPPRSPYLQNGAVYPH